MMRTNLRPGAQPEPGMVASHPARMANRVGGWLPVPTVLGMVTWLRLERTLLMMSRRTLWRQRMKRRGSRTSLTLSDHKVSHLHQEETDCMGGPFLAAPLRRDE